MFDSNRNENENENRDEGRVISEYTMMNFLNIRRMSGFRRRYRRPRRSQYLQPIQ